jgi:hypothetical protein
VIGRTAVLGFGHRARQGKNAAAEAIHAEYPEGTKIYGFADALRTYCRIEHGMTVKDAPLLQRVGLEKRQTDPNFWVNILRAQLVEEQPKVALIIDVRFPNEVEFCDAAIKVTRMVRDYDAPVLDSYPQQYPFRPYVADDRPADHPSETALDGYTGWYRELTIQDGQMGVLRSAALMAFDDFVRDVRLGRFTQQEAAA